MVKKSVRCIRCIHTAAFKVSVAPAALSLDKALAHRGIQFELQPNQITERKKQFF